MSNILKKITIRWFIILTLVFAASFSPVFGNCYKGYTYASNYSTTPIVFSNIEDEPSGSGYPSVCYSTSINGYNVNGHIYVRFRDLAQPLGATYTIAPGPTYILTINGQSNYFYPDSTNSYSLIFYRIVDRSTGQTVPYSFDFHGTLPYPVITINGYPCVWVKYAALALGSLLVHWDNTTGKFVIYHWRVNKGNPLSDNNNYLVGGEWLDNWDNSSDLSLAPHFKLGEDNIWSNYNPSSASIYYRQLKVSTTLLQNMENTRHLVGDVPFSPSCVFRSYWYNKSLIKSWRFSWHMKGRAMDAGGKNMRDSVINDIKAVSGVDGFYYSTNPYSVSQWDEVEAPYNAPSWLHGQCAPTDQYNHNGPVPHCP